MAGQATCEVGGGHLHCMRRGRGSRKVWGALQADDGATRLRPETDGAWGWPGEAAGGAGGGRQRRGAEGGEVWELAMLTPRRWTSGGERWIWDNFRGSASMTCGWRRYGV